MLAIETFAASDIATLNLPERRVDYFFPQAYSKHHKCFCVTGHIAIKNKKQKTRKTRYM